MTETRNRRPDEPDRGASREPVSGRPPPDMAALMLELARIRQEVEGAEPPSRRSWSLGLLVRLAGILLLGWLLSRGPCSKLVQPSGMGDLETSEQTTPRPAR